MQCINKSIPQGIGNQSGYTLYIVLILFTVFSILVSIILIDISSIHGFASAEKQKMQAKLLAKSGIIRAEYFLNGGDGHGIDWETPDYSETINGYGTIKLSIQKYGVYSKITSTGTRLKSTKVLSGICGRNVPQNLAKSLTMAGHVGGLVLPPGSDISGYIVLDHGSVSREKQGKTIPEYQNRITTQSSSSLPFDSLFLNNIFTSLAKNDTLLQKRSDVVNGDIAINNSQDTLLRRDTLCCTGTISITGVSVKNKVLSANREIKLLSGAGVGTTELYSNTVTLENCNTQYCLIYSRTAMHLETGNHNTQFFTKDSIFIGTKITTEPFSVFACQREAIKDSILSGGIIIADNATVNGILVCSINPTLKKIPRCGPAITFGRKCRVNGVVISDNDVYMSDVTVCGFIYVRSVVTVRDNMSYTNFLFNVSIQKPYRELPFFMTGKEGVRIVMERE